MKIKHPNCKHHNWLGYKYTEKFLIKFSPFIKGHVYDLGCGEKPYEKFILQFAEKYTGIDWGISFHDLKADILSDLNKPLPIEDNSADTIISISVLEHLFEPQMMINESYRILKNNGHQFFKLHFSGGYMKLLMIFFDLLLLLLKKCYNSLVSKQ